MRVIVKLLDQATPGKTASSLTWSAPPASCFLVSTAPSTGPCPGQVVFAKPRQRGGNKISYSIEYIQPLPKVHGFCLAPQEKPCLPTQCSFWNTYSGRTCLGKHLSFQPLSGPQALISPVSVRYLGRSNLLNSRPQVNYLLLGFTGDWTPWLWEQAWKLQAGFGCKVFPGLYPLDARCDHQKCFQCWQKSPGGKTPWRREAVI